VNSRPIILTAALVLACATQAYAQDTVTKASTATAKQNVEIVTVAKALEKIPQSTFSPDYSHALTPGQMTAAWQAELDRVMPMPPSTP
jgi:hypothetical protein